MANLYLQPYKKFVHQSLLSIIVAEEYRGKGVGAALLEGLLEHAKEKFQMEFLHLEVYQGNPAIHLYQRAGFEIYGIDRHFIKEKNGQYRAKILMQRKI
jgi:putative acetyltransferase